MRDKKDSIIFLLSLVLTIQVLLFVGLAVWHVNTISDIEEEAEYATMMAYTAHDRSKSVGELTTDVYMELQYAKDRITVLENRTENIESS